MCFWLPLWACCWRTLCCNQREMSEVKWVILLKILDDGPTVLESETHFLILTALITHPPLCFHCLFLYFSLFTSLPIPWSLWAMSFAQLECKLIYTDMSEGVSDFRHGSRLSLRLMHSSGVFKSDGRSRSLLTCCCFNMNGSEVFSSSLHLVSFF